MEPLAQLLRRVEDCQPNSDKSCCGNWRSIRVARALIKRTDLQKKKNTPSSFDIGEDVRLVEK